MKFQIESPPHELDEKVRNYLRRQFEAVDVALAKDPLLKPAEKYVPDVQKEGTLLYFKIAIPDSPVDVPGLYFVDVNGVNKILPVDLEAAGAAKVIHTHSISDVLDLQTELNEIDSRITAIETQIDGINFRLDNIESGLP